MNPYTAGGLVAGLVGGFLLGRAWAEYFRAVDDGRRLRAARKNYRGGTLAFYVGGLIVFAVLLAFGFTA